MGKLKNKMAAPVRNCILSLSRLAINPTLALNHPNTAVRNFVTQNGPLGFKHSPILCGEPKKKKKVDIQIYHQREQKRKRKLEKSIARLVKKGRPLKPIDEIEGDRYIAKTMEGRERLSESLSFEELEERALLLKDWQRYRHAIHKNMMNQINRAQASQQKALDELRAESEELYQQAIQIDPDLLPYEHKGPLSTPPIEKYDAPDGDYFDTTKVYDK